MPAQTFNLKKEYRIEQGATYGLEFTVVDEDGDLYDLTAATCAAQVRETKDSATSIAFTSSINTTTSVVTLTMTAAVTGGFTYYSGYWDCELTIAGTVTRLLEGTVTISQQVTQ
ncbi:MAG: hypothetical protein PHU53_07025 [Thermoplasmata archaeon]|jgi:hypothetical protein|nr:hypothetical protein [Thermoplasmata archaeon]